MLLFYYGSCKWGRAKSLYLRVWASSLWCLCERGVFRKHKKGRFWLFAEQTVCTQWRSWGQCHLLRWSVREVIVCSHLDVFVYNHSWVWEHLVIPVLGWRMKSVEVGSFRINLLLGKESYSCSRKVGFTSCRMYIIFCCVFGCAELDGSQMVWARMRDLGAPWEQYRLMMAISTSQTGGITAYASARRVACGLQLRESQEKRGFRMGQEKWLVLTTSRELRLIGRRAIWSWLIEIIIAFAVSFLFRYVSMWGGGCIGCV